MADIYEIEQWIDFCNYWGFDTTPKYKNPHGKAVSRRFEPYHNVTVFEDGYEEWMYIGD